MRGDPFESISISDGKLHICLFGGSSWRFENKEELLVIFSNADTQNNGSLAESYFYYDGIGIRINDDFSAFVSYEDIRYMLNYDYWSEFVLQNGYVPTIHEFPG